MAPLTGKSKLSIANINYFSASPDIDGVKVAKGKAGMAKIEGKPAAGGKEGPATSDSFNKFYNKELKVSEGKLLFLCLTECLDEIPLVLMELNESALNYINRD